MAEDVLKKADRFFKQQKFSVVIRLLEPVVMQYRSSFEFYYLLGASCLYTGDLGGAHDYLQRARHLDVNDLNLQLALAALCLRRGEVTDAIDMYLDVLELDPKNKTAKDALAFIKTNGDLRTIQKWVTSGKIKEFYPPTGVYVPVLPIVAIAMLIIIIPLVIILPAKLTRYHSPRLDLNRLTLSADERRNAVDKDAINYRLELTEKEINQTHRDALTYFEKNRDNLSQFEINKILNSNANVSIKNKAAELLDHLRVPSFEDIYNKDNFSYADVAKAPWLYQDCWIVWPGRVVNVIFGDFVCECDLVVGENTMKKIEAIVPLSIPQPVTLDEERPIQVLAQIKIKNQQIYLEGKTVYQPIESRLD